MPFAKKPGFSNVLGSAKPAAATATPQPVNMQKRYSGMKASLKTGTPNAGKPKNR